MKLSWRDVLATLLAIAGGVIVFAKLQSYSWAMIGSWRGALGVIAVLGLGMGAVYFVDWIRSETLGVVWEIFLWAVAGTVTIANMASKTSKAGFVWSAVMIGIAWLYQLGNHAWDSSHDRISSHFAHGH